MRIAMWSGPRNLSTALMYSFGSRTDCAVWDEPYYAAYLAESGHDHPMKREILAAGEADPAKIAQRCLGPIPDGKAVFYQKHMTHHILPQFQKDWMAGVTNVFLIRHPARVLASYHQKRQHPSIEDIGVLQQVELFDHAAQITGTAPPVIDCEALLQDPAAMLEKLCGKIGIAFQNRMLVWPKGGHKDDGVWASHWYNAVHNSTGFAKPAEQMPDESGLDSAILKRALPLYEYMADNAL